MSECAYVLDVPRSSPFHHKGGINSILTVMSGYAVSAEWTRMIVHIAYLATVLPPVILAHRKHMENPLLTRG